MQYTLTMMLTQRAFGLAITIAAQVKALRNYIKEIKVVVAAKYEQSNNNKKPK
jgi:hypothetical protein